MLDAEELNEILDLGDYPRFKIAVELGMKSSWDKESYFRNATMVRKLTYISELVMENKDYAMNNINEKDNNSPFATKINNYPSG